MRVLAFAVLLGCGHAASTSGETGPGATHVAPPADAAAPPTLDNDAPRLAQKSTEMFQAIAKVMSDASTDCATVSAKLDAIATADADTIAANAKVLHGGHDKIGKLKAALEPHQQDLDTAAQTIGSSPTMKACSGDPVFREGDRSFAR